MLSEPDSKRGGAGWGVASVTALLVLAGALRLRTGGDRVGPNEMLATSYGVLVGVALLEWLAGGNNSPYSQLYILPLLWTVFVHPPVRVAAFFAAYASGVAWSLHLRGGFVSQEVGELAMQALIQSGMAIVGMILISGLRTQRAALRTAEDEARQRAE